MAHGEIVSIPPTDTCSLRPVLVNDSSDFEGLIRLLKRRHLFPLSHLMDVHVRHVRQAQNPLDTPTFLEQQPEVRQGTEGISGDTTWAQPCQHQQSDLLYCVCLHTVMYSCQTQSNTLRLLHHI